MSNLGNVYPAQRPSASMIIPALFLFAGGYFSFHHPCFSFIYQYALLIVASALIAFLFDKSLLGSARLFAVPSRKRGMGIIAGAFLVLVGALFLFARLKKAPLVYGFYRASSHLSGWELMILLMLLVIPFEEVFFRGYLQHHLANLMGKSAGFVCASLIFAFFFAMAGGWWTFAVFLATGLYLGYVYLRTASMVLTVVLRCVLMFLAGFFTF